MTDMPFLEEFVSVCRSCHTSKGQKGITGYPYPFSGSGYGQSSGKFPLVTDLNAAFQGGA
jgi:hypothetical protein